MQFHEYEALIEFSVDGLGRIISVGEKILLPEATGDELAKMGTVKAISA